MVSSWIKPMQPWNLHHVGPSMDFLQWQITSIFSQLKNTWNMIIRSTNDIHVKVACLEYKKEIHGENHIMMHKIFTSLYVKLKGFTILRNDCKCFLNFSSVSAYHLCSEYSHTGQQRLPCYCKCILQCTVNKLTNTICMGISDRSV